MDALAQYGSDSSSDNEEEDPFVSTDIATPATAGDATAITTGSVNKVEMNKAAALLPISSNLEAPDNHPDPESSRKRRRRWDMPQQQPPIERKNEGPLPTPPLGSNTSLIYWDKDYLGNNHSEFIPPKEPVWSEAQQQHLTEKLNQLHATFSVTPNATSPTATVTTPIDTSSSSWALHLKGQQEFHNPHFLNSVISHFELNVLGSNIPRKDVVEEFEYNLVAMEEEARYRQQQQLQFQPPMSNPNLYTSASATSSSSSLLVQSDLERAMRGRY